MVDKDEQRQRKWVEMWLKSKSVPVGLGTLPYGSPLNCFLAKHLNHQTMSLFFLKGSIIAEGTSFLIQVPLDFVSHLWKASVPPYQRVFHRVLSESRVWLLV